MAVQAPKNGYQESLLHQSPEETEVECPVCLNVVCESKLATCCGRRVCAGCIDEIESGEKCCPLCSQQKKLVDDKRLEQTLNGLMVYSSCKEKGSKSTGELGEVSGRHVKQPTTDNLLTGCQCRNVCCEACQSRQCQCQQKEHHLSSSCPEREIECEYRYVGCDFQGSQLELDGHMSEAVATHLALLSKFVQSRLSQKDCEIKAVNEELKKSVPQKDSNMKEALTQPGQGKDVEMQQHTGQSQGGKQQGGQRTQQSKNHDNILYWVLISCLFLVASSILNAYLYQTWCSECSCGQDLHEERADNLYVKKIDLNRQVQLLDCQVETLEAKMDELMLAISTTARVAEGVGNNLNMVKEILQRIQLEQRLAVKGYGYQKGDS